MDNDFINNILEIEKQLHILEKKSDDLANEMIKKIEGLNFLDKSILVNKYENLLISITHEVGTEIGFFRNDFERLNKYIHFRIKYNNFTDEELEKIIDTELTLLDKKNIFMEYNNNEIRKNINEIKHDWNKTFENIGYKKLKTKIKLEKI